MASFIETYLHKSLPEITYDDFKAFYGRKLDENQTLEYKSGELLVGYQRKYVKNGALDKVLAQDGFIKLATSIAGLANAQGGLFVLGIKEVVVKGRNKQTLGKRPGAIYPVPTNLIQKEAIEDKLRELIQFPIDDLTILPLRATRTSKQCIYLIDIQQSILIPHRVNQADYPQRYNFETRPMVHYQISDLFGKRLAPSLDVLVGVQDFTSNDFAFRIILRNSGRAIAKYPMCLLSVIKGSYIIKLDNTGGSWTTQNPQIAQYMPGSNVVVYTSLPLALNGIRIVAEGTSLIKEPLTLQCIICAESVTAKAYLFQIDLIERRIIDSKIISPYTSEYSLQKLN